MTNAQAPMGNMGQDSSLVIGACSLVISFLGLAKAAFGCDLNGFQTLQKHTS